MYLFVCSLSRKGKGLTIKDKCRFDTNRQPRVDGSLNQRGELIILAPESPGKARVMEERVDESVVRTTVILGSKEWQEGSHDQPSTTSAVASLVGCGSTDRSKRRDNI